MNTITWLVAALAVVQVVRIFVVGYPDEPLTPAQSHYVRLLDDALYEAGYIAGMSSGQSSWTGNRTNDCDYDRFETALRQAPRPNMTNEDAAAANALHYQDGWDDGATSPFNATDANARRERLIEVGCGELALARNAVFPNPFFAVLPARDALPVQPQAD